MDRRPVETVCYVIGALLMLAGALHVVVFLIDDTPWEGPVSWRKPTTFGLSFGLTLISIAWVASYLVMSERSRTWLLGIFAADCVLEVAGISIQAWRRVPSHFNTETPVDRTIAMSLAFGGAVLVAVLGTLAVIALRGRIRGGRDLRLALRAGFALMLLALATGVAMIANGTLMVRGGDPQRAYETAGSLKPVHGVALHAVLVLPAIAEVARLLGWSEQRRHRIVMAATVGYVVATLIAAWLSLR
jgi:hypothetical protein